MDDQWQDPLLLTDVPCQEQSCCDYVSWSDRSLEDTQMEDPSDFHPNIEDDVSRQKNNSKSINIEQYGDKSDAINGRSFVGFSLTSPDLVICSGSPDIPCSSFDETPEFLKTVNQRNAISSVEVSLERGINGETEMVYVTPDKNVSGLFPEVKTSKEVNPEDSFELLPDLAVEDKSPSVELPVLRINAGGIDRAVNFGRADYLEDRFFTGGDIIRTEARIGDAVQALPLYQSARFGNFSYNIKSLEAGNYVVDLHFAEIVFTDGPSGMRVFDVYMQEEKVASGIDIYAKVGSNKPLVLPDLKAAVNDKEELSIRFEGIVGNPILCGISVRKDALAGFGEVELLRKKEVSQTSESELLEDSCSCKARQELQKLRRDCELQYKELAEMKRSLVELKKENELKSRECQEAWMSLQGLQNELMRKSMHVGSLAFAIEGQVKEKSQWFSSLRDLTKKLKILKLEHIKLSEEAMAYQKCLTDMTQMTSTIQSTLNQHTNLEREHGALKLKFIEGAKERKELYNKVLELKGNIRVFCRCRPLNTEEIAVGAAMTVEFDSAKDGELTVKSNGSLKKVFKFDAVFSPHSDQVDVFEDTAPFATSVLDGYNVCIFAYGQTGTGKTFTMEGTEEARGVNYRTLEELFRIIKDREKLFRYEISVSVLEVYNEQIRDLLLPGNQLGGGAKRLEVRQVSEGTHHVPGLVEANVNNMNEVWEVLQTGSNARAVGSTNANEHSSRSHCIHCVMVKGENFLTGECTRSKLWLVDLAGSERVAKTDVQGERLKEAQNINRSLSALGDVISALAMKSPHIPFRNSKLTHLLQDSLGGDSKTLMFVQISPNENDLSETLCSLNFASRVRGIELGPAKKQLDSIELLKYKQMVEKAKQDLKSKDGQIKKMEDTIYGLETKMKTRDLNSKNLQDKVRELESQLLIERKLARQHVDSKIAEQHQQQQQQQQEQKQQQEEEQSRPPLTTKLFGSYQNINEPAGAMGKGLVNPIRPLTENNYRPSVPLPMDGLTRFNDTSDKENKPDMAEQPLQPRRTGRASLCPTVRRLPMVSAPRRNSLIPLPTAPSFTQLPQPLLPLPPPLADLREDDDVVESKFSEQTPCNLREQRSGTKKISSILRRSLQKKVQLKSPLQQHIRRGGVTVEKVRISIGSRGRMGQRVLLGNACRATKEVQQKQTQKAKERGWNLRTTGKTAL